MQCSDWPCWKSQGPLQAGLQTQKQQHSAHKNGSLSNPSKKFSAELVVAPPGPVGFRKNAWTRKIMAKRRGPTVYRIRLKDDCKFNPICPLMTQFLSGFPEGLLYELGIIHLPSLAESSLHDSTTTYNTWESLVALRSLPPIPFFCWLNKVVT